MSKKQQTFSEAVNELNTACRCFRDTVADEIGLVKLITWLESVFKRWRK